MTLPRSTLGTTSLGAVGGARGTAAGALRIIVEFLTTYDAGAVKQLENDLASLSSSEAAASAKSLKAQNALATSRERLAKVEKSLTREIALQANPAQVRREVKRIKDIGVLTKAGQAELAALKQRLGPQSKITQLLVREATLKRAVAGFTTQTAKAEYVRLGVLEQQAAVQSRLGQFQAMARAVPSRLAGLALGAVGGIAGGALIGVGFAAAEAAIDAIGEGLQDLIDPARHARESIKEVGEAINSMVDEETPTRMQAVDEWLKALGISADERTRQVLASAAADSNAADAITKYRDVVESLKHPEALRTQNLNEIKNLLIEQDKATGNLRTKTVESLGSAGIYYQKVTDDVYYLSSAIHWLNGVTNAQTAALKEAAAAAREKSAADMQAAATAQIAAYAFQKFTSAVQQLAASQASGIDAQIEGLRDAGPSAKTLALEAQIEKLQNAASGGSSGGASTARERANIAEERALILLRMRLRLMGTAINLEQYEGKFLLEAINAKIKALQKQAAAQARLNRLLDLQFRASQTIRRSEGETIHDFLERRAQEQRDILTEQRDLEREGVEARLQELQEKTQDEVALGELAQREKDLAERAKTASVKSGTSARLKELQKELAASKKADADALQSKIKALEKEKQKFSETADEVVRIAADEEQDRIRLALRGSKTIEDLMALSAQIQGTRAAVGFLKSFGAALVGSGAMTQGELNAIIQNLGKTLYAYYARRDIILGTGPDWLRSTGKGPQQFAHGGIIPLNNSSTPFGSNVRFGDGGGGSEAAVILQHDIAKTLRGMNSGQIGPFYVQSSEDPLRAQYRLKNTVREAVQEAMR